ncbi:Scr1 family TA system antitoxin-like transcriptional regulator [Streptomyces sp. enrichment culture]|uniref:Scr1 family TA system antitoxin-like transcriptional regulator n=1 Tax=Streptomyces sp. enrichment culture TaxID=1795815 RepID=UPI003F549BA6
MSTPANRPVAGITDRIAQLYRRELLLAGQRFRADEVDENFVGTPNLAVDTSVQRVDRQIAVENAASRYRAYASLVLPHRFQTADYARHIGAEIPSRPFAHLQENKEWEKALPLLLLDRYFLSRPIGDHQVMAGQLVFLLSLIEESQAEVRVVDGWMNDTVIELQLDHELLVTEGNGLTIYRADRFQVPVHTYDLCLTIDKALSKEESHRLLTDAHDHHARMAARS